MPSIRHIRRPRLGLAPRIAGALLVLGLIAFAGQASFGSHTVVSGDTLWAIARANGISVDQLAAANGISPGGTLRVGTHLTIPSASGSSRTVTVTSHTTSSSSSSSSASSSSATPGASASFCSSYAMPGGSEALPSGLAANPSRLALRPLFVEWANEYGVSPALVEAIGWQESGWQEGAVSSASAEGVGQLLPSTSKFVSQQLIGTSLNTSSASDNIRMSARYLAYLAGKEGSTCKTIAAYYEGPDNMARYGVLNESVPYVRSVSQLIPRFS